MRKITVALFSAALASCGAGTGPGDGGGADGGFVDAGTSLQDAGAPDAGPDGGGPTDVPFSVVPIFVSLPDGSVEQADLRLVVQFSLGAAGPIEGILDTGSSGIQILGSLLPPAALAAITLGPEKFTSFYSGGLQASGHIGTATVTLGDRATATPVQVVVYDELSCQADTACLADGGSLASGAFEGYPAIFGVGLRTNDSDVLVSGITLGSVIAQLPGQPAFIVKAPDFGGDAGILRIGPSPQEIATYTTLQLPLDTTEPALPNGTPSWDDENIPACIDDTGTDTDYCATGPLDTGTSYFEIAWAGQPFVAQLRTPAPVSVEVGPVSDPLAQFNVTVGNPPQLGLDVFLLVPPIGGGSGSNVVLGLPLFSRYNVLFDPLHGQVGLLSH